MRFVSLAKRAAAVALLGITPVLGLAAIVRITVREDPRPTDFDAFWTSGRAVLHGVSPYPALAALPHVAERSTFAPFVYPAPGAVGMTPFALLPFGVAAVLWLALSAAAVAVALRLLGVTDWRCYGAVFLSVPVVAGLGIGTMSPLLALGVAVAWRYRDRALVAGAAVGAVTVAKLFLWPLALWLLCTRRYRAAAVAIGGAAATTLGAWAAIGFAGLHEYPALLARLTGLAGPNSYSLYALGRTVGAPAEVAQYAPVGLALLLVWAVRRCSDRTVLLAALAAALVASPILWPHYLVLLVVPLAFASPRLTWPWIAPELLWFDQRAWSYGRLDRILPELALAAVVFAAPYVERSVSSTWSAWVSGFTLRMTRLTLPSSPITKVERSTPM